MVVEHLATHATAYFNALAVIFFLLTIKLLEPKRKKSQPKRYS